MTDEPTRPVKSASKNNNARILAIVSLILGTINLCAWLNPLYGFLVGILGIVLGYLGMQDRVQKNLALTGIVLSGCGIILAAVNILFGPYTSLDFLK